MRTETKIKKTGFGSNTEIDWCGQSWVDRTFSHPENTVRVGTAFSGIGSPEMALDRLGVKHKIMFACDINKLSHLIHPYKSQFVNQSSITFEVRKAAL